MPATQSLKLLHVRTRQQWRQWLESSHESESEIWLVFHKAHSRVDCISYEDAIEEALCFGWIDSLVKRLDEQRYGRKFTPRKLNSRWSSLNRRRYARLKAMGLLTTARLAKPPTNRTGDAPRPAPTNITSYIKTKLKTQSHAWLNFSQLSPSCRRQYIAWIDSAKKQETKQRRLTEALQLLSAGKKLGLK
jgi:uncharacterized protein YdeI (YjbR/CyaY-like superfamily)